MHLSYYSFAATLLPLPLTAVSKQLFLFSGFTYLQLQWLSLQFAGTDVHFYASNLIHTIANSAKSSSQNYVSFKTGTEEQQNVT